MSLQTSLRKGHCKLPNGVQVVVSLRTTQWCTCGSAIADYHSLDVSSAADYICSPVMPGKVSWTEIEGPTPTFISWLIPFQEVAEGWSSKREDLPKGGAEFFRH